MEHISRFPAEQSHYSRNKNASRMYLSPLLNIAEMYRQYEKWCVAENIAVPVSERQYTEIFETHFNYGFGSPKSDTCSKCALPDHDAHKLQADKAFEQETKDKNFAKHNENVFFITFDLQKTLPLPKLSTGVAFYLRQLWLYNLGVHLTT